MARIIVSDGVKAKLASKHDVGEPEVHQCFSNRTGALLTDTREDHQTDPPTNWFIAPTNKGRLLKVCYVQRGDIYVRTCYPPNDVELTIYRKYGQPIDF